MGVNRSRVSNRTGRILHILTFNNTDTLYWYWRDFRRLPVDGTAIKVDGLVGGAAVKVGVVYDVYMGMFIFDLFRVPDGVTLTINEMTEDNGVTKFGDDSGRVERLKRGMSIKVSNDHASGVLRGLEMASNVAGIVSQAGNIANMIVAHPLKQAAREASPSKKTLLPFGGS